MRKTGIEYLQGHHPNAKAVIDGEICSLDRRGRTQFKNLLFRRGNSPCFFAFDLLTCDGMDLRTERLIDRKQELRRLLTRASDCPMKYTEYIDGSGMALFQRVCDLDLEGIVAKHKSGPYIPSEKTALGSRFAIAGTLRCRAERNCLNGSATKSLFRAGIRVF